MNNNVSDEKLENMTIAGRIVAETLDLVAKEIKPGVSTAHLDRIAREHILKSGARPSFYRYSGFPKNICVSINEEVVHGIPREDRIIQDGDIVSIDIGACYKGYHGDAARTIPAGNVSEDKLRLIKETKQSFFEGIKNLKAGSRLGDIGASIQRYVEKKGYSVVRDLVGHGVGKNLHEFPNVPNYGTFGTGVTLKAGQTIAIEPMVNMGTYDVVFRSMWDCKTRDGKPSAHYENTIMILEDGVKILTMLDNEE